MGRWRLIFRKIWKPMVWLYRPILKWYSGYDTTAYTATMHRKHWERKVCRKIIRWFHKILWLRHYRCDRIWKMIRPAFTNVVGTYPEKKMKLCFLRKLCNILESRIPKWAWKLNWILLEWYFNTSGTGMQNFLLSGYFTEYQNQTSGASVAFYQRNQWRRTDFNGSHVGF